MAEWIKEWRTKVYRLRLKKGFKVIGAWTVVEENRFVWILGWEGPGTFEKANKGVLRITGAKVHHTGPITPPSED